MNNSLTKFRDEIDLADEELILLLKKRIEITRKVREYKIKNNLPLEDLNREKEIIERLSSYGVPKELIEKIYVQIFNHSKCQK
ncbi:MAG: chorismate mutase [archaeon]|nr:chorismate mutase [archaeon]